MKGTREEREGTDDRPSSANSIVNLKRVGRPDDELLAAEDVDEDGVLVPSRVVQGKGLVDGRGTSLEVAKRDESVSIFLQREGSGKAGDSRW